MSSTGPGVSPASAVEWFRAFFSGKATCSLANIPGPKASLSILGSTVTDMVLILPSPAPLPMAFTVTSYNGFVRVALQADEEAVGDPDDVVGRIEQHFDNYCNGEIAPHVM